MCPNCGRNRKPRKGICAVCFGFRKPFLRGLEVKRSEVIGQAMAYHGGSISKVMAETDASYEECAAFLAVAI